MSEMPEQPQAKKIIVDEDWKAQVQAEKEAAQPANAQEASKAGPRGPLPPPSLSLLVTSLGMQAMVAMGLVPNPISGKLEAEFDQAKHLIDTIEMLRDKTQGNRTAEESAAIEDLLHELRLSYVTVLKKPMPGPA